MEDTKQLIEWAKENAVVRRPLKYAVLAFSFSFWIIGALFAAIGGWTISQKTGYINLSDFATAPGAILATLGCLIFIVSTFGVIGSLRENICFLRIYKCSLLISLVFEVCAGLVGFAFWPEVKKILDNNLRDAIENYTENQHFRDMIDVLQRELECCGSLTIDDWDSNRYFTCRKRGSYRSCGVPWSCCLRKHERNRSCGYRIRKNRERRKLEKDIHTIGCLDKAFEFMKNNMYLIGGLAIACTLPLIFGVYMLHRLIRQIRKQIVAFNEAREKFEFGENSRPRVESPFSTAY